jgi:hypothetical protein
VADAELAQLLADAAGFADHLDEPLAFGIVTHGRAAAHRRPYRCDHRAYFQILCRDFIGELFDVVARRVNARVRLGEEQVDAVELDAVDLCGRGEFEHFIKADWRL